MRHLTESQAVGALDRKRPIEQLLAPASTDRATVEWLRLSPGSSGVTLVRHHVRDVGSVDFMDVHEFPPVDPAEEHGEGTIVATFAESTEALAASTQHGARTDRWVAEGVVQDEYADAARH